MLARPVIRGVPVGTPFLLCEILGALQLRRTAEIYLVQNSHKLRNGNFFSTNRMPCDILEIRKGKNFPVAPNHAARKGDETNEHKRSASTI